MRNKLNLFSNNQGTGGFEKGSYDLYAVHPAEANWTRQSRFSLPLKCDLLWKTCVRGTSINQSFASGSFTVDRDNNVLISDYDASLAGPRFGRILTIKNNSEIIELFRSNKQLGSPVLVEGGRIYVTSNGSERTKEHKLFCLGSDGTVIWDFSLNYAFNTRPVVDSEENIYVYSYGNQVGILYSLNKEGIINWSRKFSSICWYEPIITADEVILLGLNVMQTLCAFQKDGALLWEREIGQGLGLSPLVINAGGTIYACLSNKLYALHSNGEVKWEYKPSNGIVHTGPAMDKDGNLYVVLNITRIAAISSEGKEIWQAKTNGTSSTPPIIDNKQLICQQSFMRNSADDISWIEVFTHEGEKILEHEFSGSVMSTVVADNNILYTTSQHHKYLANRGEVKMNAYWDLLAIG